ncbi:hypothetical protein Taro_024914, partial [Colocasia esculenta]|nr:hypothetical protein [Colocasia esculenta]
VPGALWAGWLARIAYLFSVSECDRGVRRVLIVTPRDVAFWLLLFWLVIYMRTACRAWGGRADVDKLIATGSRVVTWLRRSDTLRSQPSCIFKKPWQNRAFTSSARTVEELLEVRESRRLPICLLVPGRTVAEQGLRHHQQCNSLSLYTSGYAPGSVVLVYGFS